MTTLEQQILGKTIRIKSKYTNTYLNVYGSNDYVANNSNVTVYELDTYANSQKWIVSNKLNKIVVSTCADNKYELDYYRGSSNYGNCTMYNHGALNDMTDAQVEISGTLSSCKIKNVSTGTYLTTVSNSSRSDVQWKSNVTDNTQNWIIEILTDPVPTTNKELNMPGCHNQKYTGYSVYFNHYCCGACSVAHVAEYYRKSAYSNANLENDLISAQVISTTYYGAKWEKCPYGKIGSEIAVTSKSSLYSKIKDQIDSGRPVIIKQTGGPYGQHYVVAYKYINGAQSDNDIYVLDSANLSEGTIQERKNPEYGQTGQPQYIKATTHPTGRRITLKESLDYNQCTTYGTYMLTSPN